MFRAIRGFDLFISLAFVFGSVPLVQAQTTSAYVYVQVQGRSGAVYGYNASSSGQLTPIPGSPFKPGTKIIGSNGSQFFTLGSSLIHSYKLESDGAIGSQLSKVAVYDYAGSSCGRSTAVPGAELDHSGKYIYAMLDPINCTAYQSYAINRDGSFTFEGDTEEPQSLYGADLESVAFGLPSILGNETYAYAEYANSNSGSLTEKLVGFRRESSGRLQLMQFGENDPGPNNAYSAHDPDASPTGNYVVVQLNSSSNSPTYLASYAVDSQGNLSSTNTYSDMPKTTLIPDFNTMSQYADRSNSTFSPAGNLFVVYGGAGAQGSTANGIEIYHFNGANPLTPYKKLLTGTPIDQVAWDRSNHLYAISNAQNKLWVFTVTSTSVTLDTSHSVGAPFSMVVVNKK